MGTAALRLLAAILVAATALNLAAAKATDKVKVGVFPVSPSMWRR